MRVVKRYKIDGEEVTQAEYRRRRKSRGAASANNTYSAARPLESISMCCHPNQVARANERFRQLGLTGCEYRKDGTLLFTSRGSTGRNGFLKHTQHHDSDAGYGDRAG